MMRGIGFLLVTIVLLVPLRESVAARIPEPSAVGQPDELPLPVVPATLRTPHERAAYILDHFWDAMDFTDTLRSRNETFMEQNLVNFFSLFPHAESVVLAPAVGKLLQAAAADKPTVVSMAEIAEKYLYEPDSPLADETYYLCFLQELLDRRILDEPESTRYLYQIASIRKNFPGTKAADFRYTDRRNRRRSLYHTRGERLLLVFFDPSCVHCTEVMAALENDPTLRTRIDAGELTVLAVFADGEYDEWIRSKNRLPRNWLTGLDISGVQEQELYVLRSLPALYLLDKDKNVLLKETTREKIEAHFNAR